MGERKQMKNKVFISFKMHDDNGRVTRDYYLAKELYDRLNTENIDVFFSDVSILNSARADYKRKIDEELDIANLMVLVATKPEYANSSWVRYEWDSFFNDILSGGKKGEFISLLESSNVLDFPRTIRQTQSFNMEEDGLNKLIQFIKKYFEINSSVEEGTKSHKGGSSYGYDIGNEKERLKIQTIEESKNDYQNIKNIFESIGADSFNVLDFGCSMGENTFRVFNNFGDSVNLLGIDKFEKCVNEFNEKMPDNYRAVCLDADKNSFSDDLKRTMVECGVNAFHLVYCALSLHHTADTLSVLKVLWDFILPGGFIYVRTCDDGLKMGYPDKNYAIKSIIEKTSKVKGVSDRFHGRKMYSYLKKAKFVDIKCRSFSISTADKDVLDRYALFSNTFLWRKNYFKRALDEAMIDNEEQIKHALDEYNWCLSKTDEIEDMFNDLNFYYEYSISIFEAKKRVFD